MDNVQCEWDPKKIKDIFVRIIREYKKTGRSSLPNSEDYEFNTLEEVYQYVVDVVLSGDKSVSAIRSWVQPDSNGPDIRRDNTGEKIIKFFYGTSLDVVDLEEEKAVEIRYSDFVKEKVFNVHEALINYLRTEGGEDEFWEMYNVWELNKVAVPDEIRVLFNSFITQYLEVNIFGEIMIKDEDKQVDLKSLGAENKKTLPNLDEQTELQSWFQLGNIYDVFAEKYIKPVLQS